MGIGITYQQFAHASAKSLEALGATRTRAIAVEPLQPDYQAPYLNDSDRRVRNCVTLPSSILTSNLVTSAMRRSRRDFDAVFTALRAASSQDCELMPIT